MLLQVFGKRRLVDGQSCIRMVQEQEIDLLSAGWEHGVFKIFVRTDGGNRVVIDMGRLDFDIFLSQVIRCARDSGKKVNYEV